jgi:predicted nucleic-acid-binding Zn-ribbon protein
MAYSKCPKCENSSFEMVEQTPKGSAFKLMFVQCALCNTVVGVMDYYNIGSVLRELARKIGVTLSD